MRASLLLPLLALPPPLCEGGGVGEGASESPRASSRLLSPAIRDQLIKEVHLNGRRDTRLAEWYSPRAEAMLERLLPYLPKEEEGEVVGEGSVGEAKRDGEVQMEGGGGRGKRGNECSRGARAKGGKGAGKAPPVSPSQLEGAALEALWLLCRTQMGAIEAALLELGEASDRVGRLRKEWQTIRASSLSWQLCEAVEELWDALPSLPLLHSLPPLPSFLSSLPSLLPRPSFLSCNSSHFLPRRGTRRGHKPSLGRARTRIGMGARRRALLCCERSLAARAGESLLACILFDTAAEFSLPYPNNHHPMPKPYYTLPLPTLSQPMPYPCPTLPFSTPLHSTSSHPTPPSTCCSRRPSRPPRLPSLQGWGVARAGQVAGGTPARRDGVGGEPRPSAQDGVVAAVHAGARSL